MGNWFYKAHIFLAKYKAITFSVMLLLFAGLGFLVSKIQFEEDISKLIPVSSENKDLSRVLKTVNFTDKIIVNIQLSEEGKTDDLIAFADEFLDSLQTRSGEYVKYIRGKIIEENLMQTMDFLYDNLPLFLEPEDYQTLENKIQSDSIEAITQANYRTLISPSGIISKDVILKDPLGISFIGLKKLRQLGVSDDFVLKEGYLMSKDEKHILLFITPAFTSSETAENGKFAEQIYALQNELYSKYEDVSAEYFGAALIAVANANRIKNDIQFTVGITFTILILILILFYRRIYIPVILFVSPAFGVLLAMAFLSIIRPEISAISLGIGSVLMGVTLDYSIHILTHIRNNEKLEDLFKDVTEPVLMSSLSTALAFLCLLFLNSQALQDLAIFAAVSVLGASVFALFFIPLAYSNPNVENKRINILDRFARYPFHEKKWLLATLGVFMIISAFTAGKVSFDRDISKLNYEPKESKQALKNLDKITDISAKSVYLATYGKSLETTLQVNDSIHKKLELLKDSGDISSFNSLAVLVRSEKEQRKKIARWKEFWTESRKDSVEKELIASGEKLKFKPHTFQRFYEFLDEDFETLLPDDYQEVPAMLLEDFITTETDFTTITNLVKLNDDDQSDAIKTEFKKFPNTLVIDRQEMNETFLSDLKGNFNTLILYCLVAVLVVLSVFFRGFSLTFVTILPIFFTWLLTLGIMGLFGISFNIFNIIITTVIFGLGIDYSIFMTKGLLKELKTGEKVMFTYKTSIMLSVLTTILGIGVLIFAKHPALFSISVVSVIGMSAAMLNAFTIQPLVFRIFIGSQTKPPVKIRMWIHSVFSFAYFGLGGILISFFAVVIYSILQVKTETKKLWLHNIMSKYMKSVLYTNPFVKKQVFNPHHENFKKPAVIIANHTSFLDTLTLKMLNPKLCFLVNDWVYNSPIFGKAVQRADFYPVSEGIEKSIEILPERVAEGYSVMAFPEGSRSTTNKIRRFHKGAFYLAEKLELDILAILIHGNSEVNPKGSFIIHDGSISLKILPRIPFNADLGSQYSKQGKEVGAYFRKEFLNFRKEIEGSTYFHPFVLNEYRYKDRLLYTTVKNDLKTHSEAYYQVLWHIGKDAKIAHFSEDYGQLDFLLIQDGADRKISSVIEHKEVRKIVKNSYLTQKYGGISFSSEVEVTDEEVLIISSEKYLSALRNLPKSVKMIILLKSAISVNSENMINLGYKRMYSGVDIIIFKFSAIQ